MSYNDFAVLNILFRGSSVVEQVAVEMNVC